MHSLPPGKMVFPITHMGFSWMLIWKSIKPSCSTDTQKACLQILERRRVCILVKRDKSLRGWITISYTLLLCYSRVTEGVLAHEALSASPTLSAKGRLSFWDFPEVIYLKEIKSQAAKPIRLPRSVGDRWGNDFYNHVFWCSASSTEARMSRVHPLTGDTLQLLHSRGCKQGAQERGEWSYGPQLCAFICAEFQAEEIAC